MEQRGEMKKMQEQCKREVKPQKSREGEGVKNK